MPVRSACLVWLLLALGCQSAPFSLGNIVVVRVGDGSANGLDVQGSAVFLDEFTPNGNLQQSVAVASGSFFAGAITGELLVTRSPSTTYLSLIGYGSTASPNVFSSPVPRVIARIDCAGNVDTSTQLADQGGRTVFSAVTIDGSQFWFTTNGGLFHTSLGATASTYLVGSAILTRQVNVFDGRLYVVPGVGASSQIVAADPGLPVSPPVNLTNLSGLSNVFDAGQFLFVDLDPQVPGVDTLYFAEDDSSSVYKYGLDPTNDTWLPFGSILQQRVRGLAGRVIEGSQQVLLFLIGSNNELLTFTDITGERNGTISGTADFLALAADHTAFRSVSFTPCHLASSSSGPTSSSSAVSSSSAMASSSSPLVSSSTMFSSSGEEMNDAAKRQTSVFQWHFQFCLLIFSKFWF